MFSKGAVAHVVKRRGSVLLRLLGRLLIAVLALVGLAAAGMLALHGVDTAVRASAVMDVVRPWLRGAQLLAALLLWLYWPQLVHWLARRRFIGAHALGPLLCARHRVLVFVLLAQLVLVWGWPFSLRGAGY